jgi:uncharacterized protein (DUF4415 family)
MPVRKLLEEFEPGHGFTKEDWDEVSDNPELTDEELAQGRPFAEVFPDLAASIRETLAQRELTQEQISLHVDRDVVAAYKDGGPGWRERMNEALKQGLAAAPKET